MPRIYIDKNEIQGRSVVLDGERAAHISRSLRMRVGDELTLCDGENTDYFVKIEGITKDSVTLEIMSEEKCVSEPPYKARLFMAMPKADKMELIIQKAVETGVYSIVPFISERCISRPDEASLKKKTERWNKIAKSAAEQCGRGVIPEVCPTVSFAAALEMAGQDDRAFICYECEKHTGLYELLAGMREKSEKGSVSFFVGAEGGFSEKEVENARNHGINSISLGKRILRCETAPVYVLSVMSAMLDE